MRLNIEKVLKVEGLSQKFDFQLDLSSYELWGEKPFTTPIPVTGEVVNRAGMIILTTQANVHFTTKCARCLKELSRKMTVDTENYVVSELHSQDDEDRLILVENSELDLDEIVSDNIVLNMPMRELCSKECKGLCPKCGINLNFETCNCNQKEVDPRLAILKTLL